MSSKNPTTQTITINPTKDVFDIQQAKMPGTPQYVTVDDSAVYSLSYTSTIKYHSNEYPVKKCVVYCTNNSDKGWFYTVSESDDPLYIKTSSYGTDHDRIYAFVVDVTSSDNTGTGTLTVTKET